LITSLRAPHLASRNVHEVVFCEALDCRLHCPRSFSKVVREIVDVDTLFGPNGSEYARFRFRKIRQRHRKN